jgi:hypothetical protein
MYEVQDVQTYCKLEPEQNQYVYRRLYNGVYDVLQLQYLKKSNIYLNIYNFYNLQKYQFPNFSTELLYIMHIFRNKLKI